MCQHRIKSDSIIHCTTKKQVQWLIDNGYAWNNMIEKPLPYWFHIREYKSNDWMPEIKLVDKRENTYLRGEDYYKKLGYKLFEFEELIKEK